MTKIGAKRTEPQKPIPKFSKKRKKELPIYTKLTKELKTLADGRSELSGDLPDFRGVQNHHIKGRTGKLYLNPFNMIILTAEEHDYEEAHKTQERKEFLTEFIRSRREEQGFSQGGVE